MICTAYDRIHRLLAQKGDQVSLLAQSILLLYGRQYAALLQQQDRCELYVVTKKHNHNSNNSSNKKESSATVAAAGGSEKAPASSSSLKSDNDLLYCVKITWTANESDNAMDDSLDNDTDTILSANTTSGAQQQQEDAGGSSQRVLVQVDHVPTRQDSKKEHKNSHRHHFLLTRGDSNRSISSQSNSTTKAARREKQQMALKRLFRHKRARSSDDTNTIAAAAAHDDHDNHSARSHRSSSNKNPLLLLSPLIHKRTVSFPPASPSSCPQTPPRSSSWRRRPRRHHVASSLDGSAMGTVAAEAAAVARARSTKRATATAAAATSSQRRPPLPSSPPLLHCKNSLVNTVDDDVLAGEEILDDVDDMEDIPEIPSMVTTHSHQQPQQEASHHEDDTTLPMANNTNAATAATTAAAIKNKQPSALVLYKDEVDEEKSYLRQMYLTDKKLHQQRTKRKLVEGTKIAAAAGAAVGVAVATAGMGIVAGLLFLGVGAAAGGAAGGAVAIHSWGRKNKAPSGGGEIIMASMDYETMKKWKACLDAGLLSSGTIKKSKWGQLFVGEGDNKRRLTIFPRGVLASGNAGGGPNLLTIGAGGERGMNGFLAGGQKWWAGDGSGSGDHANDRVLYYFDDTCKWRPLEGGWTVILGTGPQGLRIFREERVAKKDSGSYEDPPEMGKNNDKRISWATNNLSIDGRPYAPLKSHVVLNAAPLDAFLCLMSFGLLKNYSDLTPNCGQRASFRIIETIDDNTDIIHLICNPLYLFPCWTFPRDFVLYRYWRVEHDGCFVVCYESVTHNDCPPHPDFVRGDMHQVITFAPDKKTQRRKAGSKEQQVQHRECLMTAVVQVDPKGWIPSTPLSILANQAYGEAFAVAALMQLLDIRDAIDVDRFVSVALDEHVQNLAVRARPPFDGDTQPNIAPCNSTDSDNGIFLDDPTHYDFAFCSRESVLLKDSRTGLSCHPPPLQRDQWAEPDANSFRVRGPHYKDDRRKINAGRPIGRLVAVDICNVGNDGPMYHGFTMHPTERFQLALQREKSLKEKGLASDMPPFCFVVNIILPGPPFFHVVCYYAVDHMSSINGSDGTPSSRLANEFFFGSDTAFRDKTFKLIPQIVQGNFIVRKAVGSTPAIMGRKLRQLYVQTPRSLEVLLDCGSSSVATGVIRLSLGYAKTLVVDMGFLLEGDDERRLPERIFGCVRIKNLDFGTHLRKVSMAPLASIPCTATSTYPLPAIHVQPPPPPSSPGSDSRE
jgi:Protein ENHANCED DISEASE RESISTANCE 2, C-terminal/START domain